MPRSSPAARERALIEARRGELYWLAVALHIGFIRMSGRTLDAYKQVPKVLWSHLGAHLAVDPPDLGTLRTLYETRTRTLIDHQVPHIRRSASGRWPSTSAATSCVGSRNA
ncbi:Transposase for insertion sequence element IS1071 in transposon Tn5271 [Caballeronia sordidicola]|uniref:Transposase for insertion sequence element IS1071 in transposon Tn5271 n=1 Tax=Caballeronia sordidicola TaxID=196367 RepID=A0A226WRK1_CABSO|nr:Transposase for insertion sequence element IS1071 in transposon Tn5271 [Caballeronia sordidicola]